jgi:hypothetical protein
LERIRRVGEPVCLRSGPRFITDFDDVSRCCTDKSEANELDILEDVACRDENEVVDW